MDYRGSGDESDSDSWSKVTNKKQQQYATKKAQRKATLELAAQLAAQKDESESEGEEWSTVTNKKLLRYTAKKAERAAALERAALAARIEASEIETQFAAQEDDGANEEADEVSELPVESEQPAPQPKKRRPRKSVDEIKAKEEKYLVDTISTLVSNSPFRQLKISVIGDRLQVITGAPWSKKFRSLHGSLQAFISHHDSVFRIFNGDMIRLKADDELHGGVKDLQEFQELLATAEHDSDSDEGRKGKGRKRRGSKCGCCMKGCFALVLLAVVLAGAVIFSGYDYSLMF